MQTIYRIFRFKFMKKISVTIITINEEDNIERCLKSLDFADEIIVVDSGSKDKTIEIAKKYTDKIYFKDFNGYGEQKNYAASLARNDLIFSIDADEEVSDDLKRYLLEQLDTVFSKGFSAIAIPRRTYYLGKFIKNSGWYPDYKVRIYNKNKCYWDNKKVHESLNCEGKVFYVPKGMDLYHYSYRDISDHINKVNKYTSLFVSGNKDMGFISICFKLFTKPLLKFFKMYLLKYGFLEGNRGFIIAIIGSFYEFLKYAKLLERKIYNKDFKGY
ncbi:glycosyl transferase [Deferribacter desulfuricans SSM1]|uniref:Glycosyl transferase n=2 Tax=Deferribacter TaxID=53572 RepID=D3PB59_DEFDS|nr:glycosyl transferase [Deferribacter desulfuricans SSM1]